MIALPAAQHAVVRAMAADMWPMSWTVSPCWRYRHSSTAAVCRTTFGPVVLPTGPDGEPQAVTIAPLLLVARREAHGRISVRWSDSPA